MLLTGVVIWKIDGEIFAELFQEEQGEAKEGKNN